MHGITSRAWRALRQVTQRRRPAVGLRAVRVVIQVTKPDPRAAWELGAGLGAQPGPIDELAARRGRGGGIPEGWHVAGPAELGQDQPGELVELDERVRALRVELDELGRELGAPPKGDA